MPEAQENAAKEGGRTFEENLRLLSEIVAKLERGAADLDTSVKLYGEGVRLAAVCRKQLDEAKIRITGDTPDNKEGQS